MHTTFKNKYKKKCEFIFLLSMKRIILLFVLVVSIVSNLLSQQIKDPVFLNDNNYYWADSVIENLSLDERIGQLFMVIAA